MTCRLILDEYRWAKTVHFFTWIIFNPLSVNPTKQSNTLKQFVSNLPANFLSVFDNYVGLTLKGLRMTVDKDVQPVM